MDPILGNSSDTALEEDSLTPLRNFYESKLAVDEKENEQQALSTCVRVNVNMAFEYLLGCALRHENCGSRKLTLEDPWEWLVKQFVQFFGIRSGFVLLTHIKWILRPEVRSCTTHCLSSLLEKYTLLCQERDVAGLEGDELASMNIVSREIKELLATAFENYYLLSDLSETGIHDCISRPDNTDCPPSALLPALTLLRRINDNDETNNQTWIVERFRNAATKKYQRLQATFSDESLSINARKMEVNTEADSHKQHIYTKMEHLAYALQTELQHDQRIQETGVLPVFLNLTALSSSAFATLFVKKLEEVFISVPPHELTPEGMDMLLAIGNLQESLIANNSQDATADPYTAFNVFAIFEPYISDWLHSLETTLQANQQRLSEELPPISNNHYWENTQNKVFPLISEMLINIESEMDRFERLISFWPELGTQLEYVICQTLRNLLYCISELTGIKLHSNPIYSPVHGKHEDYSIRMSSPVPGQQWPSSRPYTQNIHFSQHRQPHSPSFQHNNCQGINPREAILLNSLRYLLGNIPDFECKLKSWCSTQKREVYLQRKKMNGLQGQFPDIGAQFAQIVKELRTEYSRATVICCERMAEEIVQNPDHMMGNVLCEKYISQGCQGQLESSCHSVVERISPLFDTLSSLTEELEKSVDLRVLVTLLRGLWEHLSEDLYIFVENLHESRDCQEAWKSRQNAKSVANALNEWFGTTLTHSIAHELQSKDLDLPLHASMIQKLLADNSSSFNISYTVF